jgi:hypothetical protein
MNAALANPDTWSGIFPTIPAAQYHQRRLDVATASGLKHMLRSPAHFRHWATHPEDDKASPALTFGRALHSAILEPDVFARTYAVVEAGAPKYPTPAQWNAKKSNPDSEAAKAWWTEWEANNAGRIRLSLDDYDRAQRMADSARSHPVAAGLIVGGDREITFRWHDEATGLACQSRADLYAPGEFLMDVKSCRDASAEGFARAVHSYTYDLQAAHYVEGIRACGDAIRWFVFLAIESEAPYVCQPFVLDAQAESRGVTLRQRAITRQAECLRAGRWPGSSEQLGEVRLPAFAFYGIEDNA